jgi:uncharacterized SAM-binding protein YcdF (DUF218 family)
MEREKRTGPLVSGWRGVLVLMVCGVILGGWAPSVRVRLRTLLARKLVHADEPVMGNAELIYMLGGSVRSTRSHLKRAAELYHQGVSEKILYFHGNGATVSDRTLKRDISRDAWVVKKLSQYGVPPSATEAVIVQDYFFGTYSEAEAVSRIVRQRECKSILLITSPYHTKRVRKCFDYFLNGKDVSIFVVGSDDRMYLKSHVVEYFKLKVYEYLLL